MLLEFVTVENTYLSFFSFMLLYINVSKGIFLSAATIWNSLRTHVICVKFRPSAKTFLVFHFSFVFINIFWINIYCDICPLLFFLIDFVNFTFQVYLCLGEIIAFRIIKWLYMFLLSRFHRELNLWKYVVVSFIWLENFKVIFFRRLRLGLTSISALKDI